MCPLAHCCLTANCSSTSRYSETCIKGHRSSTCDHTERPLFEIKKKGRSITQCEPCSELRKKHIYVKCLCEGRDDALNVSHSIPAKKGQFSLSTLLPSLSDTLRSRPTIANRKGPPPRAAYPFGLPSSLSAPASAAASDSEDASVIKLKAPQQGQCL